VDLHPDTSRVTGWLNQRGINDFSLVSKVKEQLDTFLSACTQERDNLVDIDDRTFKQASLGLLGQG